MEMSTLRTKRIEILKGMQGNSDSDAIFFFFFLVNSIFIRRCGA